MEIIAATGEIRIAIRSIIFSAMVPIAGNMRFIDEKATPAVTSRAMVATRNGIIFSGFIADNPTKVPVITRKNIIHEIQLSVNPIIFNPSKPAAIPAANDIIIPITNKILAKFLLAPPKNISIYPVTL